MKSTVTAALAALLLAAAPAGAAEPTLPAPVLAEDGFYHPDWFANTFLDLREDVREAAKAGKQVVVVVEQRGCGACKRVHEVNLRVPEVVDYIKPRFEVIQIDLYGSREITDFDGEKLSEKDYARKLGVRATPTFLLLKEAAKGGNDAVAWKYSGYLEPEPFVNAFAYAHEKAWEKGPDFVAWMKGPAEKVKLR